MMYWLIYGFMWLVGCIPFPVLYLISDVVRFFLYNVARYRVKVVKTNLLNSFPEKTDAERLQIEKRFYKHFCDMFLESCKMLSMSNKSMMKHCRFLGLDCLQKYFDQGRSVIGVCGHYGNWEWMTSLKLWISGFTNYALYKHLRSKPVDKIMLTLRSRFGATLVPKDDALRALVKSNRDNQLCFMALVADQTPNSHNLNFWTTFLNQDTPIFMGTEKISRLLNLPVISIEMKKVRRGYYEVKFVDLCDNPKLLKEGELTIMHTKVLEDQIKIAPELWLWSHKRWKHKRSE